MYKRDGTKMRKNFKFDKLDEWIKAEYDRETKGIEDSLSDGGSFDPNKIDSQELYQRIQSRIKEKEEQETKSEVQEKRRVITRQRVGKCAALFCVAVTGVFLASMTSEANRSYFMYKMQYLIGDEVGESNVEDRIDVINWEKGKYARQETADRLGIPIPIFHYMLELNIENAYNIQSGDYAATIDYQYDGKIVNLYMVNRKKTDASNIDFQGKEVKQLEVMNGTVVMTVLKIEGMEEEGPTFAAQWDYKEGYYQLSGQVKESEFLEILKSIDY